MIDSNDGLIVLSLFDGISAGRVALERAGIKIKTYYASEIDKYAIAVTQHNYPNTVQLGDIRAWEAWDIPVPDLIIGGSPCQGFSFGGKGLNFDDPRSKLYFEFEKIVKYYRPKYWLLENVKMREDHKLVITERMGQVPTEINSALVSAQNRERLYWHNFGLIDQPQDRGLILKDVLESGDVDRLKSYTIDANYHKGGSEKNYREKKRRQIDNLPSAPLRQSEKRLMVFAGGIREGTFIENEDDLSRNFRQGSRIYDETGKAATLSAKGAGGPGGHTGLHRVGTALDVNGDDYCKRIYSTDGKVPSLNANGGGNLEPKISTNESEKTYRKLTPLECERLQTFDDQYTALGSFNGEVKPISNSQRYKMLGNSWTVEVIVHLLRYLPYAREQIFPKRQFLF